MAEKSRPTDPDATPKCRGCGKPIFWGVTDEGKRIPLDPTPAVYRVVQRQNTHGMVERDKNAMVTHFATCPQAGRFSKGKKPKESADDTAR